MTGRVQEATLGKLACGQKIQRWGCGKRSRLLFGEGGRTLPFTSGVGRALEIIEPSSDPSLPFSSLWKPETVAGQQVSGRDPEGRYTSRMIGP